jgi:bacterioferritin-associated ferredoxin
MIVCVCNNVSSREIAAEAANGCGSFESLQDRLQIGTCCGACVACAKETFAEHQGVSRPHRKAQSGLVHAVA